MQASSAIATPVEDLVRSLYHVGLVQRAIARHAHAELGVQGVSALAILHKQGPMRISDVAHELSVDLSVASRQIAALEGVGYLRRLADKDDRRARRVAITDEGRRVLKEFHRRILEVFAAALQDWSVEDVAALAQGLDRLREDFSR